MRKKLRYNSTKLVHNNMLSNTQSQYIVHVPHDVVAEQLGPNPKMACDLGQNHTMAMWHLPEGSNMEAKSTLL